MSNTNDRSWSDMPIEILTSVAERLSPTPITADINLFHFGSVSKTWRQAGFRAGVRRRSSMPWLINGEYELFCNGNLPALKCQFSDFWCKQILYSYAEVLPKKLERDPTAHASKNGWLLLSTDECINPILARTSFFFFNPFREKMAIIELPENLNFTLNQEIVASTFTTNPTCPSDCHIFVACGRSSNPRKICRIYTCNLQDGDWKDQDIHCDMELFDVAYMDGAFYCVFSDGISIVLHVFTFRRRRRSFLSRLKKAIGQADDVEQSEPFVISSSSSSSLRKKENDDLYLVEADGDLLLAICSLDDTSRYCHIFRLDPSRKKWNRIRNLGNRVMILSSDGVGSIVVPAVRDAKEFANTIFVYRDSKHEHYICKSTEATWIFDKVHHLNPPEAGSALIEPPDLWH